MRSKSQREWAERVGDIIDRLDERGCDLMRRAFAERTTHAIDRCLASLRVLSGRAMRLQAIVDSTPRRRRSFAGATPSVN